VYLDLCGCLVREQRWFSHTFKDVFSLPQSSLITLPDFLFPVSESFPIPYSELPVFFVFLVVSQEGLVPLDGHEIFCHFPFIDLFESFFRGAPGESLIIFSPFSCWVQYVPLRAQ